MLDELDARARSQPEQPEHPDPVALLAQAAAALHGASSLEDKLAWTAETARSLVGARFAFYVAAHDHEGTPSAVSGASRLEVGPLVRPARERLSAAAANGERVVEVADAPTDGETRRLFGRVDAGPRDVCLGVPVLAADEQAHGGIVVCQPAGQLTAQQRAALSALAAHVGVALDNLATVTRLTELQAMQREVVHQLQEALRPPVPRVESAELGVHYLPADPSAPTGGDLYDWVVLPNGDLHLAVVDVVGKGVAATKDASLVTHALRLLALDGCPIDRLVVRADELVTAQSPDLVATVIVVRYRPSDGVVHVAGGGHPPALVVSAGGQARFVAAGGIPVGWPGAGSTEVAALTLGRYDTLILYTDGLIEATKDVLAGLENLTAAAMQTHRYPAHHVARALVDRALAGAMRRDDSLALVLRRRTPPLAGARSLGPFEYRFSPVLATVPLARHLFADWLELLLVDDNEAGDLLLVASELCSNAIRHATGTPGALVLRAWADEGSVFIEVEDDGSGFELADRYDDEVPDPEAELGRGLYLAEALSDDISVRRVDDRTVVRVVKRALLAPHRAMGPPSGG